MSPFSTSAGNVHIGDSHFFATLSMFMNDCESAVSIDLGVTNKFEQVGKLANMQSVHNEDCTCYSCSKGRIMRVVYVKEHSDAFIVYGCFLQPVAKKSNIH